MSYLQYINKDKIPDRYWNDVENVKHFMAYVAEKENYKDIEDWYKCTRTILLNYKCGECLFTKYKNIINLLNLVYNIDKNNSNQYQFLPWKFKQVLNGFWNEEKNHKVYIDWLFKELKYEKIADWYSITKDIIQDNYGAGLLAKYNNSPQLLIQEMYPEYEFLPWKFNRTMNEFWKNAENHRVYLNWLFKELKYEKIEDLYQLTYKIICENYGGGLLGNYYNGSPQLLLQKVYNNYEWIPWKFIYGVPQGFWDEENNQKVYMEWLFKELKYEKIEDFYNITYEIFCDNYGGGLLNHYYNSSPQLLLQKVYKEYEWIPWKFKQVPRNFWDEEKNHKVYMDWLFKELNYEKIEDFYQINSIIIIQNYGDGLLHKYNHSPRLLLQKVYNNYEWIPWKFEMTSMNFWNDFQNHKVYMDWLFKELKYEKMEDWYKITQKNIFDNYGMGLLANYYNNSPQLIIKTIYIESTWIPWKFTRVPNGFWNEEKNQKVYMEWLFKELKYTDMEDWYKTSLKDVKKNYGGGIVDIYNSSVKKLITTIYPDYPWEISKFSCLKGESILYDFLISQEYEVIWDFRVDWCINSETSRNLPFDFCLQKFNIIIELDGEQHFEQVSNWDEPIEVKKRDEYKMKCANENGYSVIRITWDDVYNDINEWKDLLLSKIKIYDAPEIIHIGNRYDFKSLF